MIDQISIYTDAAWNHKDKMSYFKVGSLVIDKNETEYRFADMINIKEYKESRDIKTPLKDIAIFEMIAIIRSIRKARSMFNKNIRTVIYTDNLVIFEMLYGFAKGKLTTRQKYNPFLKKIKQFMQSGNIEIRHIKAHVGVYGNEVANRLAQYADKPKYQLKCKKL